MIGIFKINTKEKYIPVAISENKNVMFYHALNKKSSIVQPFICEYNIFSYSNIKNKLKF